VSDAHGRRVQEQFGASAAAYVASPLHAAGEDLDRLRAWGTARRGGRVLDVATGGGHTALAFAGIARRVIAYDLTEPMLQAARGHVRGRHAANVEFVAGDATALPFRDGSFDVVTCRTAAHHFPDVGAALRQIHRVLRPGGSLLLQDILGHDDADANAFILEVERRRDPSHVRSYRMSEWKAFLRATGRTII
jgi:ubiquinone/menaquinone biosynthesis C-methylase UbiE